MSNLDVPFKCKNMTSISKIWTDMETNMSSSMKTHHRHFRGKTAREVCTSCLFIRLLWNVTYAVMCRLRDSDEIMQFIHFMSMDRNKHTLHFCFCSTWGFHQTWLVMDVLNSVQFLYIHFSTRGSFIIFYSFPPFIPPVSYSHVFNVCHPSSSIASSLILLYPRWTISVKAKVTSQNTIDGRP